jgi:hypothetical protein
MWYYKVNTTRQTVPKTSRLSIGNMAKKVTIYEQCLVDELNTYTLNLLAKIQTKFDIPVGELMTVLNDGKCNHVRKNKNTTCSHKCMPGSMYCRKHTARIDYHATELEYIEIQDKPYLYDPHTKRVYSYGKKTPALIGIISDDLSYIIV